MIRARSERTEPSDGMLATLPVATPDGWRPAADLRPGDAVFCLDAPPQPLLAVHRHSLHNPHVLCIPAEALGNPGPVLLRPDQTIALEFDLAAELYGDPVALIPARALIGWRGVARGLAPAGDVVRLGFARSQVTYAGPGLLLGCSGTQEPGLRPQGPPAPPLTAEQARHLMACVVAQEAGAALRLQAAF